jgi:hypothetical protein
MRGVMAPVPGIELQEVDQRHRAPLGMLHGPGEGLAVERPQELHPTAMEAVDHGK